MAVTWTQHRFSGGALALDAANTVVLRGDAARTFDRFEDPAEIALFAEAATNFRAEELGGRALAVADPHRIAPTVLAIRETTDELFREAAAAEGTIRTASLPAFLEACAAGLRGHASFAMAPEKLFGDPETPIALEAALAVSALSLLSRVRRLRICRNCNWLFIDRSRNGSRLWCDMAVCGNRQKARRHYRRRKPVTEEHEHA
ncbi:CGNR zinc finger domain-containing protein [Mesorhizobium sp. AaZ16]|uniref:CGNR zinc finger domain-containing protein n=1 Tax=Mesorhizobium sp. AaZ16 TaxID=3402289 RepID=UPI00374EF8EE